MITFLRIWMVSMLWFVSGLSVYGLYALMDTATVRHRAYTTAGYTALLAIFCLIITYAIWS